MIKMLNPIYVFLLEPASLSSKGFSYFKCLCTVGIYIFIALFSNAEEQVACFKSRTPFPSSPAVESAGETVSLVADINPGWRGSYPCYFTIYKDQLFFRANYGLNNTELWCYDGTNASIVAEIMEGPEGSSPANLVVLNNRLYFNATTKDGYRLWQYDGTNLARVTNANPPYAFFESAFWKPVLWGGELCYPSQGKIYMFNGERFGYLNAPPWAQMDLVKWNGALYYAAQDSYGVELWRYNGLTQTRISDINPDSGDANPECIYAATNGIYFHARNGISGNELYCFDGNSIRQIADINPGRGDSNPGDFCEYRDHIYFCADDGVHGYELWRTDGTNVELVADINTNPIYEEGGDRYSDSFPSKLTVWKDKLYFTASVNYESGLWCYDGEKTYLIGGGTANADNSINGVYEIIVFKDSLYFDADDGVHGRELWQITSSPQRRLSISPQVDGIKLNLIEAETGKYVIQTTSDFINWESISTNYAVDGCIYFNDSKTTNFPMRVYRAILAE